MHRYRVIARYGGKDYMIHDAMSDEQIYDDELSEEAGKTPYYNFAIPPDHENIGKLIPLATKISIKDNGREIYDGRVVGDRRDIINSGVIQTVGAMSYMMDTQQEPTEYTGGINGFIDLVLSRHNSQCEMKITRGDVAVTDSNDYINRSWSDYVETLSLLNDKLVKTHGGYLRLRHISGNDYKLDYLSGYGDNLQVIRLGENLTDIESQVDASEVYTRIIPLGSEIESTEESETKKYTTVESVNGGKKYVERDDLIAKYGTITKCIHWDDVTVPENLLKKAQDHLAAMEMPKSFTVNVVDLSLVDDDVPEFELGKMTRVSVPTQGIDLRYQLTKRVKHLTAPQNDTVTLGPVQKTITQIQQQEIKDTNEKIIDVEITTNNNIVNTGKTITGAKGGCVVLDTYDNDGKLVEPWRILIMDSRDKKQARNVIQFNINGLGFSNNGINGDYRNAWTVDGKLCADFIRTGNLIFGGSDYNTSGALIIKDAQDNVIGSWDKTGLSVLRGIIQGVSAIFGGLNNQNGALEVRNASNRTTGRWDKDGIYITEGVIDNGPLYSDGDIVKIGDYETSTDGSNVFRSTDGSITIQNEQGGPFGSYAAISINGGAQLTEGGLDATQVITEFINGDCVIQGNTGTGESNGKWNNKSLYEIFDYLQDQIDNIDVGV